jgi:outer membrane protein assembly factor BamB
MLPLSQTISDPFDVFLSSPVAAVCAVFFGSGDGHLYALDAASGELRWKFKTGDVVHASPAYSAGTLYFGSWDSWFYAVDAVTGKEKWRFHGGEDALIHNQVGFPSPAVVVECFTPAAAIPMCTRSMPPPARKWRVNNQKLGQQFTGRRRRQVYFGTSDSSLFQAVDAATGKPVFKQQLKAYVFSSPSLAGNAVYLGVLNGTMEARDRNTGELLWTFQTEASKQNRNWILTADGKFNSQMFYQSNWHEGPMVATDRQFAIGAIFAAPLVADGVVYIGSADGYLYAIE